MKLTYKQYELIRTKDLGPEHELVAFLWILCTPGNIKSKWSEQWNRLARKHGAVLEEYFPYKDQWVNSDSYYWLKTQQHNSMPAEHYEDYAVI